VLDDDQEVILTLLTLKAVEIELVTECLVDGKVKCLILAPTRKSWTRLGKKTFRWGCFKFSIEFLPDGRGGSMLT
jgi:hypothetical protein